MFTVTKIARLNEKSESKPSKSARLRLVVLSPVTGLGCSFVNCNTIPISPLDFFHFWQAKNLDTINRNGYIKYVHHKQCSSPGAPAKTRPGFALIRGILPLESTTRHDSNLKIFLLLFFSGHNPIKCRLQLAGGKHAIKFYCG